MKLVHFLRHGQALHNPRAEAARDAGCANGEFLRLMKEDDAFDADLTDLGRAQAAEAAARLGSSTSAVELVVASPLSRALDTAMLVLPAATGRGKQRFVAHDDLRERSGWMLNTRRRMRGAQAERYPGCDFSLLETEDDELWLRFPEELEPTGDVAERGYRLLEWLSKRAESEVAVVAHGGLFHYLLNEHPKVLAADACAAARFGNCELRSCTLTWTDDGAGRSFVVAVAGAAALPSFIESNFSSKVAYEAWCKQMA